MEDTDFTHIYRLNDSVFVYTGHARKNPGRCSLVLQISGFRRFSYTEALKSNLTFHEP